MGWLESFLVSLNLRPYSAPFASVPDVLSPTTSVPIFSLDQNSG